MLKVRIPRGAVLHKMVFANNIDEKKAEAYIDYFTKQNNLN